MRRIHDSHPTWSRANLLFLLVLLCSCSQITVIPQPNAEQCDGVDNDGDSRVDEDFDRDGDGYVAGSACTSLSLQDCNDDDVAVHPNATELCGNALDDDCNGEELVGALWYPDTDGDGVGIESGAISICTPPEGYASLAGDCDDANPTSYPGAPEASDGRDTNCDGTSTHDVSVSMGGRYTFESSLFGRVVLEIPVGSIDPASLPAARSLSNNTFALSVARSTLSDDPEIYAASWAEQALLSPWLEISPSLRFIGEPAHGSFSFDASFAQLQPQSGCDWVGVWQTDETTGTRLGDEAPVLGCSLDAQEITVELAHFSSWQVRGRGPLLLLEPEYLPEDGSGKNARVQSESYEWVTRGWRYELAGEPVADAANTLMSSVSFHQPNSTSVASAPSLTWDSQTRLYSIFVQPVVKGNEATQFEVLVYVASSYLGAVQSENVCPRQPASCTSSAIKDSNGTVVSCPVGCAAQTTCYSFDGDTKPDPFECLWIEVQPDPDPQDDDHDGHTEEEGDCDDNDASVHPGDEAACNGLDENCDGAVDNDIDADGDGYLACGGSLNDCDDQDDSIHPGEEIRCDGVDEDCDGEIDDGIDVDGDGYLACGGPEIDCNDQEASVHPGEEMRCDGIDEDCDGVVDDGVVPSWYADEDGDGFGDDTTVRAQCEAPSGFTSVGSDCDEADSTVHPNALEYPSDGKDNDCDGHWASIVQIVGGDRHTLALDDLGYVWAWGDNLSGQLGDGTFTTNRMAPIRVSGLSDVKAIAAGHTHSLALDSSGAVWSWGSNTNWALGTRERSNCELPALVARVSDITNIAAGGTNSFALDKAGHVWVWGDNNYGQIGNGTTSDRSLPVEVTGLPPIRTIAAGSGHILAVDLSSNVWAWGLNSMGQLGNGGITNSTIPNSIGRISGIVSVSAGGLHSLALDDSGQVWGWGANQNGQVSTEPLAYCTTPVAVSGMSDVVTIAAGHDHSIVADFSGQVWAFGFNHYGQIGDGTLTEPAVPVKVLGLDKVVALAAGKNHSLALDDSGVLLSWGDNYYGQLGNRAISWLTSAAAIDEIGDVVSVAAGDYYSLAVDSVGRVWSWGDNAHGQLGNGTTTARSSPALVHGVSNVASVVAGNDSALALDISGQVWGWGYNGRGQLGVDGGYTDRLTPEKVNGMSDVVMVATGQNSSIVIDRQGEVWAWGATGLTDYGYSAIPTKVIGLSGAVAVDAGDYHWLAADNLGQVWAWGNNQYGQLGDGTTVEATTPVKVIGLSEVIAVAASGNSSWALDNLGQVWAWGDNTYGNLGDGTNIERDTPVLLDGLNDVVVLTGGDNYSSSGHSHSLAADASGQVWAWGDNTYGQLGDGSSMLSPESPILIEGLEIDTGMSARGIMSVFAAGGTHSLVIQPDSTIAVLGSNAQGQLGIGEDTWSPQPVVWGTP